VDVHGRYERAGAAAVDVTIRVQPEHAREGDRFLQAAVATLRTCDDWLGELPTAPLTLVDPAWHAAPPVDHGAIALARTPWWTTTASMAPELATSRAVSRRVWDELVDRASLPPAFADALVEYTARRAVVPIFQRDANPPGYAFFEPRYFGGFVPRFVRLRRLPETDDASRALLAIGTLDRWLGRPVFDVAVAAFVHDFRGRRPALEDFERTISAASGEDLSWFFGEAFRGSSGFDYGIERLETDRQPDGSWQSTVVVRRYGDARFTGTSQAPDGPFERGRALELRVAFDRGVRSDRWDGRDATKTFVYLAPSPAVSAELDPDRILLLDTVRGNNRRTPRARGPALGAQWMWRWAIWFQDLLLTCASLA
jgi:hypothetical protein